MGLNDDVKSTYATNGILMQPISFVNRMNNKIKSNSDFLAYDHRF